MKTLKEIKRKIKGTKDLNSVVRTMKALAAVSIREYEKAVQALSDYSRTVEMGFQILLQGQGEEFLKVSPPSTRAACAVVYGTDQGMVGQFNERIARFADKKMNELGIERKERLVLAVGERASESLTGMGQGVEAVVPVPSSANGIRSMVQEVLIIVDRWRSEREIDRILLFHHQPKTSAAYYPGMISLLPIDQDWLRNLRKQKWISRSLPFYRMDRRRLFSFLIHEYLFIALYRAFADSLACENGSRLASMQAAEKNITERLGELSSQFHHQRQNSITSELLDIVSGFEALTGGEKT